MQKKGKEKLYLKYRFQMRFNSVEKIKLQLSSHNFNIDKIM